MKKNRAHKGRWWGRSEEGQSLVEFAASVVVLMVIVAGVLDIGRAFMIFVALENGAGEGAAFASFHPTWLTATDAATGGSYDPTTENITYRATHESPTGIVDWNLAQVSVTYFVFFPPRSPLPALPS